MIRLFALLALTACTAAPTVPDAPVSYRLVNIDGTAFAARATISFMGLGQFAGSAPCNSYSGELLEPLPAFTSSRLTSTEMACEDLPAETVFFAALATMNRADITGPRLRLSDPAGRSMEFVQF
jgi:heat shock protein HslJ